jgi:hypothetical protein
MARPKKELVEQETGEPQKVVTPNDLEWTDHVLSLLSDDEKISGNPTTDGLRRVFETALDCTIVESTSLVSQSPSPENEKRATVVHSLSFVLNNPVVCQEIKYRTVSGAADVYWGNCDKIYRNHPVAVAETRAEGRALRRALKLRKVVAAEELAKDIEDHPDGNNISKISSNQINFIDVLSKRMNINVNKLLENSGQSDKNIYNIEHGDAINIIKTLSSYQQDVNSISEDIRGYDTNWK